MSVRKRSWTNSKGQEKTAWIVDYPDAKGVRRQKTFSKKKEADAFAATATIEVREGTHVTDRETVTVAAAGKLWIATSEAAGLERSTVEAYKQRLDLHITPFIGAEKLSKITVPVVRAFADTVRGEGRSSAMVKKALTALGAILSDAQERGLCTRNAVKEMSRRRNGSEKRSKQLLQPGVDIPTPDEIRAFLGILDGRWRPILLTAVFSGLRSSELRGLRWQDVDFAKATISVRQRSDKWGEVGATKSHSSQRTLPVPPVVVNTLKGWKLACPPGELVFPNGRGNPESHANVVNRGLNLAMKKAGLGYTGLHVLRHFYASWLINPKEAGGLGLDMKTVQARMGHSSIVVTADVYSHLFPRKDDGKEMADAAAFLMV
ncbi:integrase [Aureimonas sp. Leaf454]|uniref:tyrosine-type recombinase/integrase n=1 Tax=Aureimonas sp. Leaf454 TaxID=1736381 RepID=UPI0007015E3C|nr:site-specific integrase [Aureimonas sp. Leaf454]KQT53685.1 integrase [Aureimonas sp. Leaf454]